MSKSWSNDESDDQQKSINEKIKLDVNHKVSASLINEANQSRDVSKID